MPRPAADDFDATPSFERIAAAVAPYDPLAMVAAAAFRPLQEMRDRRAPRAQDFPRALPDIEVDEHHHYADLRDAMDNPPDESQAVLQTARHGVEMLHAMLVTMHDEQPNDTGGRATARALREMLEGLTDSYGDSIEGPLSRWASREAVFQRFQYEERT